MVPTRPKESSRFAKASEMSAEVALSGRSGHPRYCNGCMEVTCADLILICLTTMLMVFTQWLLRPPHILLRQTWRDFRLSAKPQIEKHIAFNVTGQSGHIMTA